MSNQLRGYSLAAGTLLSALALVFQPLYMVAGLLLWLFAACSVKLLARRALVQSMVLIGVGVAGLSYSLLEGASAPLYRLINSNTGLLAMLTSVSFLSLIAAPSKSSKKRLPPAGKKGLISTLVSGHFFSAIINMSALLIIAEKLSKSRSIDTRTASLLTINFAVCALWSPFFAAMAYTLILVPNMSLLTVMSVGAPMGLISLAMLYWLNQGPESGLTGYPLKGRNLVLPALLAITVIVAHEVWPTISITQIIAISAPVLVIVVLLFEGRSKQLHTHIVNRLSNMHNEITLFLAAGVFAIGLGELFKVIPPWLPFSHYGPLEACLTLGVCLIAGRLGVHVIMIMAVIAPLLLTLEPDPNLLAMTFLSAWGLGSSINPVSGTLLAMQGNYNISGSQIARANSLPVVGLYALNCVGYYIYSALS
ncbi:MAG: hypothetical protein KC426_04970 [Oceanospirillaceae bacterium]|nr:hypothetical protein [Oceanospirillaceae bacterium]